MAGSCPPISWKTNSNLPGISFAGSAEDAGFKPAGSRRFLEENEYFTVSFFPEACRKDLGILGSRSGRDGDKVALTSLTPVGIEHGVDFAEAELTFVCKKLYAHQFEKEQVPPEVAAWIYSRVPPHTMFIGEIVDGIEK